MRKSWLMRGRIQILYQPAPVPYMIQLYSPPPIMMRRGVKATINVTLIPT